MSSSVRDGTVFKRRASDRSEESRAVGGQRSRVDSEGPGVRGTLRTTRWRCDARFDDRALPLREPDARGGVRGRRSGPAQALRGAVRGAVPGDGGRLRGRSCWSRSVRWPRSPRCSPIIARAGRCSTSRPPVLPDAERLLVARSAELSQARAAVERGEAKRYFVKPWIPGEVGAALEDAVRIFELRALIRTLRARLETSERFATLGRVSAGIAHELSGPAAYIAQNAAALRRELAGVAAYVRRVARIRPDARVQAQLRELVEIIQDVEVGAEHVRGGLTRAHRTAARRRAGRPLRRGGGGHAGGEARPSGARREGPCSPRSGVRWRSGRARSGSPRCSSTWW